jgi:hypothetical protein
LLQKCDLAHSDHLTAFFCSLVLEIIENQFDVTENKTDCELGIEVAVEGSSSGVINLTCAARGGAFG